MKSPAENGVSWRVTVMSSNEITHHPQFLTATKICDGAKAAHRHALITQSDPRTSSAHCADCRPAPHHLTPVLQNKPSPAIPHAPRPVSAKRFSRRNVNTPTGYFHTPILAVRPRSSSVGEGLFERGDTVIRRINPNIDGLARFTRLHHRKARRKKEEQQSAEPAVRRVRRENLFTGILTSFILFVVGWLTGD